MCEGRSRQLTENLGPPRVSVTLSSSKGDFDTLVARPSFHMRLPLLSVVASREGRGACTTGEGKAHGRKQEKKR